MNLFQAIVLAIVEGLTEFLPVSSTGHMIITSTILGIAQDDFVKFFTIAIQLGAILSVVVLYWRRFLMSFNFYVKLFVAFIPAAVFGVLFSDRIDALLENALVVGITLFLGGIVFLFVDNWFKNEKAMSDEMPNYKKSLIIGFFQTIAMIPGVSRSAATIIGGLTQKLTRKAAAEFSFFLAVPTMFAATAKKTYDFYNQGLVLDHQQINMLIVGNVVAFIVALLAIKGFIEYLTKHGFKAFGYYRIAVGAVIIIMLLSGISLTI
ncbi:MAG: undecaprenyl-diphosphate phosphatase [Salinivirgaceae bacterium]